METNEDDHEFISLEDISDYDVLDADSISDLDIPIIEK